MKGRHASWTLLLALAAATTPGVAAEPSRLAPGGELPKLEAISLAGEPVTLPGDARNHPAILVIGFTKAAAKVTREWIEACRAAAASQPPDSDLRCYDVRMVEDVPKAFRGMAERGMRSGLPIELQRRTLLVYTGNDAWRDHVGAKDAKSAYVVGCDRQGRVQQFATGAFEEAGFRRFLARVRTDFLDCVAP